MKPNLSSTSGSDSSDYHLYEADKCSGILVFTVDRNDPVQLKFSDKIRVQIIFDDGADISNKESHDIIEQDGCLRLQSQTSFQESGSSLLFKENSSGEKESQNNNSLGNVPVSVSTFDSVCIKDGHSMNSNVQTNSDCEVKSRQLHLEGQCSQGVDITQEESLSLTVECHVITSDKDEQSSSSASEVEIEKTERPYQSNETQEYKRGVSEDRVATSWNSPRQLRSSSRLDVESKKRKGHPKIENNSLRKSLGSKILCVRNDRKKCLEKELSSMKEKKKSILKKEVRRVKPKKKASLRSKVDDRECFASHTDKTEASRSSVEENRTEEIGKQNKKSKPTCSLPKSTASSTPKSKKSGRDTRPRKLLLEKNVRCIYCQVTFDTKLDFFNHRRTKGSCFKCKICGKEEPFEALLMVHMQTHKPHKGHLSEEENVNLKQLVRKRSKMKCDVCGLVVSSQDSLKIHMMLHTGEYPYKCCVCPNQCFFSLSSLRHHLGLHLSSERVHCKLCDKGFVSRADLGKHQLTHKLECGLCGEIFPNKTSRNCHYRVSHADEILKCALCFSPFSTETELQRHMEYHKHSKKEQCPECGVVISKLKEHMALHSGKEREKPYACDQCPMKYMSRQMLEKHLLSHTGERPYACNKCTKRFKSNGMLRKHLLTHTLERPFVCDVCGKRFSVRSNLVTHMKIHSNTRQYPCNFCSQAFNHKNSLKGHLKAKHGSQNHAAFKCPNCSMAFQDNSLLTAHMLAEHQNTKSYEKNGNCHLPESSSNQQDPAQLEPAQLPAEVSSVSFMADHLQAYHNGIDPGLHNAIDPSLHNAIDPSLHNSLHVTNTRDLPISAIVTAPSLLHREPLPNHMAMDSSLAPNNVECMAREEILNYLGRDRSSIYGHSPAVLPPPPPPPALPSLHVLTSISMDLQHSNSINVIPSSHPLPPSSGLVETNESLGNKTLQESASLGEQGQLYPMFHNL